MYDRIGPCGFGDNNRFFPSATRSVGELASWRVIVLDPLPRANGDRYAASKPIGGLRSKNIIARAGAIKLLGPGADPLRPDLITYNLAGKEITRHATPLIRTTKGAYNQKGTEGRDLYSGQFTAWWAGADRLDFRSSGDRCQHWACDSLGGTLEHGYPTNANAHGYLGITDETPFALYPKSGHDEGSLGLYYVDFQGQRKFIAAKDGTDANFFNAPTYLVAGDHAYTLGPREFFNLGNGTFAGGQGARVNGYVYDRSRDSLRRSWSRVIPGDFGVTGGGDGHVAGKPWAMRDGRIHLILRDGEDCRLFVLECASGEIVREVDLGSEWSDTWQLAIAPDQTLHAINPNGNIYITVAGADTSASRANISHDENGIADVRDPESGENYMERAKMVVTPSQVHMVSAAADGTNQVRLRITPLPGAAAAKEFIIPVPCVDRFPGRVQVDDAAVLDGRLYALVTYRDHGPWHSVAGGGQFLAILE